MIYDITIGDKGYRLQLTKQNRPTGESQWLCRVNDREITVDSVLINQANLSLLIDGRSIEIEREITRDNCRIFLRGRRYDVAIQDARSLRSRKRAGPGDAGPLRLTASMPGKVVRVLAKEGDKLQAGTGIVVVEAMKMQNEIRSPKEGILIKLLASEGMNVNAGDVLAIVE
jgi:biotin carboxyl carrier protein